MNNNALIEAGQQRGATDHLRHDKNGRLLHKVPNGFITCSTKALTPELEWVRAMVDGGSAHLRKRKRRDGGEPLDNRLQVPDIVAITKWLEVRSQTMKRGDIVQELKNEAIVSQATIYEQLSEFDFSRDQIQIPEIVYFVLTLAICSLFRWSGSKDAPTIADNLSVQVLKLNIESDGIKLELREAIKTYQARFKEYRASLPTSANGDWFGFGLQLSENITGQKNPLIGDILCATTTIILGEFKTLIEDMASIQ
jgi:hypothetical protein